MACACSLEATTDRLAPGTLSEADRILLRELELVDPNEPAFEAHMVYEETVLAPFMTLANRYKLTSQHAVIRQYRAQGVRVNLRFFAAHKAWEQAYFPTLGVP